MSKYEPLWKWIADNYADDKKLTFDEIENVLGFSIDHSFLTYKKELPAYGYQVRKISMKEKTVFIEKL